MYSPKIPDHFIPPLYHLGQARERPMTHLVAEAVERYLASEGCLPASGDRDERAADDHAYPRAA
ncbi:MAG: hypothetical protein GEU80_17780 [Dehalococcoidia bacterium]|nr:hypothetical protein [Dehalococcoidia bacterium]